MSKITKLEDWGKIPEDQKLKQVMDELGFTAEEAQQVVAIRNKSYADFVDRQQRTEVECNLTKALAAHDKQKLAEKTVEGFKDFGKDLAANKKEVQHQAINWCGTLHYGNIDQLDEEAAVAQMDELGKISKYVIFGKETCKTTGQKHLQFYFQLKKRARLPALKKILPSAHLEKARGDDEQNYAYCSKEGDFEEIGERTKNNNGKREQERWQNAKDLAIAGNLDDIDPQIFVCQYRSLATIKKDYGKLPEDTNGVTGVWLYGLSGAGKSYTARKRYPGAYLKTANKWWDGYDNEEFVIIEDIDKNHECLGYFFKIWADLYAFRAEIKGSAVCLRPKVICITSQYHPSEIWSDQETVDAICRRYKVERIGPTPDTDQSLIDMHMQAIKFEAANNRKDETAAELPEEEIKLTRSERFYKKRPDTPRPSEEETKRVRFEDVIDLLEEHDLEDDA